MNLHIKNYNWSKNLYEWQLQFKKHDEIQLKILTE